MPISDSINKFIGSWTFIIIQSIVVTIWVSINLLGVYHTFDPYPFILLNLFFSTEAAYATPLILMSSIRQSEKEAFASKREALTINKLEKDMQDVNNNLVDIKILLTELVALNKP